MHRKFIKSVVFISLYVGIIFLLSSCSYDKTVVTLGSEFDNTWSFNSGAGYDFDSNLVEVVNGKAQLKALDLEHSGSDFENGNHLGSSVSGSKLAFYLNDSSLSLNSILASKSTNLVGYWRFDEDANNTAPGGLDYFDSSNSGLHAFEFNDAHLFNNGKIKNSVMFDGITNNIRVPHSEFIDFDTNQNFTIVLWLKAPRDQINLDAQTTAIIEKTGTTGLGFPFTLRMANQNSSNEGKLQFSRYNGTTSNSVHSSIKVNDNRWHHIAIQHNNGDMNIFIDGKIEGTRSQNLSGSTKNTSQMRIGGVGSIRSFTGGIDELGIYNSALSANEIAEIYNQQNIIFADRTELSANWTPKWDNIVGYWKMDGNWQDSSGSGKHGVPAGDVFFSNTSQVGTAAASFDDNDDVVEITDSSNLSLTTFSISAWMKMTGTIIPTIGTLVSRSNNNGIALEQNYGLFVSKSNGFFNTRIGFGASSGICNSLTDVTTGWHHIALVGIYDGLDTQSKVYVDGVLRRTCLYSGKMPFSAAAGNLSIGAWLTPSISSELPANIDDVAIWSTALSSMDMSLIYNRQKQKYASHFDSEVIDLGNQAATWPDLSWSTSLPFGKELVGDFDNNGTPDSESSSDYSGLSGDLSNGLVGYWPLNEAFWDGSLDQVKDQSINANHCQSIGDANTENSILFKRAGSFDGDLDYLNCGSDTSIDAAFTSDFTVGIWAKPDSFENVTGLIGKRNSYVNQSWSLIHTATLGQLRFLYGPANANILFFPDDVRLKLGDWNHVVVIRSGNIFKLFINGELKATETATDSIPMGQNLVIGNFQLGFNETFDGSLDEVAIWDRAIPNTDIVELYRRGANRVKLQVKSCVDSTCNCKSYGTGGTPNDCDGDTVLNVDDHDDIHMADFIGPGGDGTTFYSELYNRNTTDITFNCALNTSDINLGVCAPDEITLTGSSIPTGPEFLNIDYTQFINPSPNRYAQYRVYMEADENTACGGEPCLPELTSVSLNPSGNTVYSSEYVEVRPSNPITFTRLARITIDADSCATFRLARAGVEYYYDSGAWTPATGDTDRSSASDLENHAVQFATQFGPGELEVIGYLKSDSSGSSQCRIDEVDVGYK